jgi:hypothetical protein
MVCPRPESSSAYALGDLPKRGPPAGGYRPFLQVVEPVDAGFGAVHHFEQARAREGVAFGRGLEFDAVAVFGHDEVHVGFGLGVFG